MFLIHLRALLAAAAKTTVCQLGHIYILCLCIPGPDTESNDFQYGVAINPCGEPSSNEPHLTMYPKSGASL